MDNGFSDKALDADVPSGHSPGSHDSETAESLRAIYGRNTVT